MANHGTVVLLMGVSGSGKSTVGAGLAKRLGWAYAEADDFHPPANIDKMSAGLSLNDEDRAPWLAGIGAWIDGSASSGRSAVVTCSGLKRRYRDFLAGGRPQVQLALLDCDRDVLERRMAARSDHFFPAGLLDSQLRDLELPQRDERVLTVRADQPPDAIVDAIVSGLRLDKAPLDTSTTLSTRPPNSPSAGSRRTEHRHVDRQRELLPALHYPASWCREERAAVPQDGVGREPPGFDVKVPTSARVWNYWVGGTDNFPADREAGEQILEAMPTLRMIAQMSRRFLIDVVHDLVAERGIRQFLDIGTGLPTADNTHDVAQRAAPDARIVYADYDPVVLTHAKTLLTSTPEGKTDYIQADVRDPDVILSAARRTLDFSQPVAVILIFVMHFVPDAERPYDVVGRLMEPLPSGSYLVMGHAASDIAADFMAAGADAYNDRVTAQITPRDRAGVSRFFDGLEMIGPGLVPLARWFDASGDRGLQAYCGVGKKV